MEWFFLGAGFPEIFSFGRSLPIALTKWKTLQILLHAFKLCMLLWRSVRPARFNPLEGDFLYIHDTNLVLKMEKKPHQLLRCRNDIAFSRHYPREQFTGAQDLYPDLSLEPALFSPTARWCFCLAKYNQWHWETLGKVTVFSFPGPQFPLL